MTSNIIKVIFTLVLILIGASSIAVETNWKLIASEAEDDYYIDPELYALNWPTVSFLYMQDFKVPMRQGFRSQHAFVTVNCVEKTVTFPGIMTAYTQRMARGKPTMLPNVLPVRKFQPTSPIDKIQQEYCKLAYDRRK